MIRRPPAAVTVAVACGLAAAVAAAGEVEVVGRPRMRQMEPPQPGAPPPSQRDLVDAREILDRRFRASLSRADTAAGANAAAALLLEAAVSEEDLAVKWLMLAEARRFAAAAGDAAAVDRSIVMADAAYEFDALAEEQRFLRGIPLRALDPVRAGRLAEVAEGLAERAEIEERRDVAAESWTLAIRGWQRAGDAAAARRAAERLNAAVQP